MKIKKSVLIIGAAIILTVALVATILIVINSGKDLSDVVGKTLSLSDGISYCEGITKNDIDDDISDAFMSVTTFKVVSLDKEGGVATLEISSPPIKNILNECLPSETYDDFDDAFNDYIDRVKETIENTAQADLVSTTIKCSIIESKGTKIMVNNDFLSAVYTDIYEMLNEILLNSLSGKDN
jgi:hypothetical protein